MQPASPVVLVVLVHSVLIAGARRSCSPTASGLPVRMSAYATDEQTDKLRHASADRVLLRLHLALRLFRQPPGRGTGSTAWPRGGLAAHAAGRGGDEGDGAQALAGHAAERRLHAPRRAAPRQAAWRAVGPR